MQCPFSIISPNLWFPQGVREWDSMLLLIFMCFLAYRRAGLTIMNTFFLASAWFRDHILRCKSELWYTGIKLVYVRGEKQAQFGLNYPLAWWRGTLALLLKKAGVLQDISCFLLWIRYICWNLLHVRRPLSRWCFMKSSVGQCPPSAHSTLGLNSWK